MKKNQFSLKKFSLKKKQISHLLLPHKQIPNPTLNPNLNLNPLLPPNLNPPNNNLKKMFRPLKFKNLPISLITHNPLSKMSIFR